MNVECGLTSQQSKGTDNPNDAKAVVAMQMRDEDVPQPLERDARTAQLDLRTLATVYHEQLATTLHDLHGREVVQRRQCAAAAQYVYFEWFHR
jgi:hypothetical protein